MKILFIANPYLKLYREIESEFQKQGHQVVTILDVRLKFDPYWGWIKLFFLRELFFVRIYNIYAHHWKKMIKKDKKLSESYDVLFVLSGTSIDGYLVRHLQKNNPDIKKILYTWDSCNHYNFARLIPWFDKCYTFDILDVKNDSRWELLPIYYKQIELNDNNVAMYDLFSVGTNHDGRYSFFKKLIPQFKENGLKYYIKLVELQENISFKQALKYYIVSHFFAKYHSNFIDDMKFILGDDDLDLKKKEMVNHEEYTYFSNISRCIFDTQRENQSGLTARFIWAIANKKKVITTNRWAFEYSFVRPNQVFVVDENEPQIPIDFIRLPLEEKDAADVLFLRIDNWVRQILK